MLTLKAWVRRLEDDPDNILPPPFSVWRTAEILEYCPLKTSVTMLGRVLREEGIMACCNHSQCRTTKGSYRLWAIRDREYYGFLVESEVARRYDSERGFIPPVPDLFPRKDPAKIYIPTLEREI